MSLLWEHVDQTYAVGWRYAGEPCSIKRLGKVFGVVKAVHINVSGTDIVQIGDFKCAFENDMLKGVGLGVGCA